MESSMDDIGWMSRLASDGISFTFKIVLKSLLSILQLVSPSPKILSKSNIVQILSKLQVQNR